MRQASVGIASVFAVAQCGQVITDSRTMTYASRLASSYRGPAGAGKYRCAGHATQTERQRGLEGCCRVDPPTTPSPCELPLGSIPKQGVECRALVPALGTADAVILLDLDDVEHRLEDRIARLYIGNMNASCCHDCHDDDPQRGNPSYRRVLWIVLIINAAMFAVEVGAGLMAGSASLYPDSIGKRKMAC